MRFSTFSTGFSTTKGISPIRTVIQAAAFWKVLDENAGILPFIKKRKSKDFLCILQTVPERRFIFLQSGMAGPKFSTPGRCRFSVWKRRGNMQFSTPEKLLLAGAPGATPQSRCARQIPLLSLRDIFPAGEVVLWDGAFGSTEKFPAKVQSLRHARGSL